MDTEQKIARGVVAILVKAIATAEGKAAVARAWGRDAGAAERAALALRAELAGVEARAQGRTCEAATKANDSAIAAAGGPVSGASCEAAAPAPPQAPPAPVEAPRAPVLFPSEMGGASGISRCGTAKPFPGDGTAIHLLNWEGRTLPLDRPPGASGAGPPE